MVGLGKYIGYETQARLRQGVGASNYFGKIGGGKIFARRLLADLLKRDKRRAKKAFFAAENGSKLTSEFRASKFLREIQVLINRKYRRQQRMVCSTNLE
jgi:hypothetical protein